jgi:hypothetical protein
MKFLFFSAAMALLLAGCGQKVAHFDVRTLFPVEGQFTWNGKPVEGATVVFTPASWRLDPGTSNPAGLTGPDGRFKLTTYTKDDGAPAGKYRITVVKKVPSTKGGMFAPNPLPEKYAGLNTTPLEVEVQEGKNELPAIELVGKPTKR